MIIQGDSLEKLKTLGNGSVNCCITSPPYWGLRDYGVDGQLGLEKTPQEYVEKIVNVFKEVKRVLRNDGTLWLNLGDTYYGGGRNKGNTKELSDKQKSNSGANDAATCDFKWAKHETLKTKDLVGIPWRVAFALQADGWYLRSDIIWHKPNPMPESVRDRPTKSHEYIFLLSKSKKYYYDQDAVKEDAKYPKGPNSPDLIKSPYGQGYTRRSKGNNKKQKDAFIGKAPTNIGRCGDNLNGKRNKRTVWTIITRPYKGAHFAVFPEKLIEPCVLAGCPEDGIVLDPFFGSGTVGVVAKKHNRKFIGIELNSDYIKIAEKRING